MADIETAYGQISTPDSPDDLIVRALTLFGEWSLAEQMLVAPLTRTKDRVWDVGAFLGTFGIGLARMSKGRPRSLLVVEPNPAILPHLERNLRRNSPCSFSIAAYAVGADNNPLSPSVQADQNNAGSISYEPSRDGAANVPCQTLSQLRAQFGDYDFLKLDIEGMENAAIRSDFEYIHTNHPVIWAECNETPESILLLEALISAGYEPLYVAFPAFRNRNFNGSREKIYPMAYEAALLAAPCERMARFTGKISGEEIIVQPVKTSYDLRRALWVTPRWALPEWVAMSRAELIATLGRMQTNDDLASFLNHDGPQVSV